MSNVNRHFAIFIRIVAALAVVGMFVYLIGQNLAPDGELTITSDLRSPAPFTSEPKPGERLERVTVVEGEPKMSVIKESPIYFDVKPPPGFDTIVQTVRYVNDSGAVLELGALASSLDEQFDLRPGESRLIDSLPWHRQRSGRLLLLERQHDYASIDDFYSDPPSRSRLAVWGTTAAGIPYSHSNYVQATKSWEKNVSLRGRHRLLTYIKDETLDISFTVQDMNRSLGADPVIVTVYAEGNEKPLARAVLDDDGNTNDDQRSSPLRTVAITATGLSEGAYQVEFTAPSDIFIRRLKSAQRLLVFADRLYLGDYVGYSDQIPSITVWSDGLRLSALTPHDEGLQTLKVNRKEMKLAEPLTPVVRFLPSDAGLSTITSPKRDVLLETDGVFALSEGSWFNPLPLKLDWFMGAEDLKARGIDYVLTAYQSPEESDGLKSVSAEYNTSKLARTKNGALRFLINVPGLIESQNEVRLASVSFTLRRQPSVGKEIWSRIWQMFTGDITEPESLVLPYGTSFEESPE